MEPALMLLDEPTSALGPKTAGEVLAVLQELAEAAMTRIVVTYELGFARHAADRVILMDGGRIAHQAPVDDLFSGPAPERVERFLSRMPT
jgi:polar amino acid transport system ATP-binding protein